MLATRNRFHGHGSLRYVYSKGQVIRNDLFVCKYSSNPRRHTPRVSIVVSKKVIKSAVRRNRIRRRLYEAVRRRLEELEPRSDIVFIVTSVDVLILPSETIQLSVNDSLERAGLVKNIEN